MIVPRHKERSLWGRPTFSERQLFTPDSMKPSALRFALNHESVIWRSKIHLQSPFPWGGAPHLIDSANQEPYIGNMIVWNNHSLDSSLSSVKEIRLIDHFLFCALDERAVISDQPILLIHSTIISFSRLQMSMAFPRLIESH
jgi:hypothetical protein